MQLAGFTSAAVQTFYINRMDMRKFSLPKYGMLVCLAVFIMMGALPEVSANSDLTLAVDVSNSLHITSPSYLSVTISAGQLRQGLVGYDFSSKRLQNLAAALAPADVRIGGTYADVLNFDPTADEDTFASDDGGDDEADVTLEDKREQKKAAFLSGELDFTISGNLWDSITNFCKTVGWDILWDFKALNPPEGPWNPAEAREFLEYSAARGMKLPMFEIGNEPNLYDRKWGVDFGSDQLVQAYETLKDVIAEMPQYAGSALYGPGVNNLDTFSSPRKYLAEFLENRGCDVISEVSLHHYYFSSEEADLSQFLDVDVMEGLRTQLEFAYNISSGSCGLNKPVRFTETSTSSGGGIQGISNAYVAGFLWLDKLGMSATYGITRVFRQTFLKSTYALVTKKLKPNPDYFLSVMYKRLVEGPVFKVESVRPEVRIYAHCVSKSYYSYPDGAIVVYYLNIGQDPRVLNLGQYQGSQVDLFVFRPGDNKGMKSRKMRLNGQLLKMRSSVVPAMNPKPHTGDVTLAPKTFGFIVIPDANVQLCKDYHS